MKKVILSILLLSLWSCGSNDPKMQQEKIDSDKRCSIMLNKMEIAKNSLDKADQEIIRLMSGIGEVCSGGPTCKEHKKIYLKRDSLVIIFNNLNQEFLSELEHSTKEYRIKYYSKLVKDLEQDLTLKDKAMIDLESGLNGFSKCTSGASCANRSHSEIYKQRDECKNQIDSINTIIKTIK